MQLWSCTCEDGENFAVDICESLLEILLPWDVASHPGEEKITSAYTIFYFIFLRAERFHKHVGKGDSFNWLLSKVPFKKVPCHQLS